MTVQIGDIVGDYKVIGICGSGGMGSVYKIEHLITKRVEAMKLLPTGPDNELEQVQRFEREIQVQARLHHPNIAALYNAIREGGSIALVMEFVEGEPLARLLEPGPLPLKVAAEYAIQVLCALAYAHGEGVIHRDVAPGNIIITRDRVAKLTDFGLARAPMDRSLTTEGVPVGSPWYMSPEQVKGVTAVDARTDIYAMGAVLYEMLTGAKLFDGDGAFAVMRAHVEASPVPPSARNSKVPPALDQVVLRALAKDPLLRFQSANDFRFALEKAVPGVRPMSMHSIRVAPLRFRPTLAAAVVASVPVSLIVGFCAVRFIPRSARVQAVRKIAASPAVDPKAAQPVEVSVAAAAPESAPELPAQPAKPARAAQSAASIAPAVRRPARREPVYAIRVSGGEITPPVRNPEPSVAPRVVTMPAPRAEAAPEPVIAEPPVPQPAPVAVKAAPAIEPAAPELPSAKPQKSGNRLVRAFGKINPFHKKDDATVKDAPAKKD
jgi:serine/threonine-protein kinase